MISEIVETFESYSDQQLTYFDFKEGKVKTGIFENVYRLLESNELKAIFKNPGAFSCIRPTVKVNLENVLLPLHPGQNSRFTSSNSLIPCNFHCDEEVVWSPVNDDGKGPFFGKIETLGRVLQDGKLELVAVVQFDGDTRNLPRHVTLKKGKQKYKNCNVVSIKDLVKLVTWQEKLKTESPEPTSPIAPQISVELIDESSQLPSASSQAQGTTTESTEANDIIYEPSLVEFLESPPMRKNSLEATHTNAPGAGESSGGKRRRTSVSSIKSCSDTESGITHVSRKRSNNWRLPINFHEFANKVYSQENTSHMGGIQGKRNSCYMDASLFALFSFGHSLDHAIAKCDGTGEAERVKRILRQDIVDPLRSHYFVPSDNMQKLRQNLADNINEEYLKEYMDVEEFLLDLFRVMKTPELFEYEDGDGDHIHQIMLPDNWEESQRVPMLSVQSLLEESFFYNDLKLARRPDGPFILKLPVSEGVLLPCGRVVPDLSLNLSPIMTVSEEEEGERRQFMKLSAIICLRHSHFVAFVRTGDGPQSPWVYMDSNPVHSKPHVTISSVVNECIEAAMYDLKTYGDLATTEDPQMGQRFQLFRDAYICIYV